VIGLQVSFGDKLGFCKQSFQGVTPFKHENRHYQLGRGNAYDSYIYYFKSVEYLTKRNGVRRRKIPSTSPNKESLK